MEGQCRTAPDRSSVIDDVDVFLLLGPLPVSHGRKVVDGRSTIFTEVLVRQIIYRSRFDAEVFERPGSRVDDLVVHLALDFGAAADGPPDELVEDFQDSLSDRQRDVDVVPSLHDFLVHDLGKFGHRVVLGAVQLICLGGCGVVIDHLFESHADINNLVDSVMLGGGDLTVGASV